MLSWLRGALLVGCVGLGGACGGTVEDAGPAGDDGSGGDGDGASTGGGSGVSGACAPLQDGPEGAITVVIENHTSETLYLGQDVETCGTLSYFSILGPQGAVTLPDGDPCLTTCDDELHERYPVCAEMCAMANAIQLEPGQEYRGFWDARSFENVEVGECKLPSGNYGCKAFHTVEASKYEFLVHAGTQATCMLPDIDSCEAARSCGTEPVTGCTWSGHLVYTQNREASATVELDAQQHVVNSPEGDVVRVAFE